jgi:hypothetical protein
METRIGCPNCGSPVSANEAFCPSCGTNLKGGEPPAGAAAAESAAPALHGAGRTDASTQRWPAWAPLLGIAFVALAVVAFIVAGESPTIDDSPQKILDFYKDNDTENGIASALLAWGAVAFLFFLGVLRTALRTAEDGPARLSAVAFGGGLILAAGMFSFAGFTFALADGADHLTPEAAQALNALNVDFFFLVAGGLGTLLISTGILSIRSSALPAWLGWIALLIGVVAITPAGFFAFLAFGLWTIAASIVLWQAGARNAPAQPLT